MNVTNSLISDIVQHLASSVTHVGVGTGAAPSQTSTVLQNEVIRKAADVLIDENAVVLELFLDETEGNGITYTNAGAFGAGATGTIGTGLLMAGGGINKAKTSDESLTVSIELTVETA